MRWLAVAMAVCAGCAVDDDFSGTRFACDVDADCPGDQTCVEGLCASSDPDDVEEPANCGRASDLDDDFGSSSTDAAWVTFADGAMTVSQGGDARVEIPAGATGEAGYRTRCRYDMTSDGIFITVEDVADDAGETYFEIVGADGEIAAIRQQGSVLKLITRAGGSNSTQTVTYDDNAHRSWRITVAGGIVEYAASGNGDLWVPLGAKNAPSGLASAYIRFGVRADLSEAADDAAFDDYNGG